MKRGRQADNRVGKEDTPPPCATPYLPLLQGLLAVHRLRHHGAGVPLVLVLELLAHLGGGHVLHLV